MYKNKTALFAMPNSLKLGKKICKYLNMPLLDIKRTQYADGEILIQSKKTVRAKDVFIIASTNTPGNENIMELLIFIDSLKRASAHSITIVLSYYGYSRQDRKVEGRQPIAAKLIADLLETTGVSKMICVDLHNSSIQGFFDIPLDDIKGQYILALEIKKAGRFTVVSPDHGGAVRARVLAELIANTIDIAIVDKRRVGKNQSETMGILGDVHNKNVVIIDDIIDTGGTIIKAAKVLKQNGAKQIIIAATHGIFSRGFEHFEQSKDINQVIVTDSVPKVHDLKNFKKLKIVSLAEFLAKTIEATINSKSISAIYEQYKQKIK